MTAACQILFDDNPLGTFYGGQMMNGKVVLALSESKQVKGIALKISGYAKTQWTEHRSHHRNVHHVSSNRSYRGCEDYIATKTFLLGQPECDTMTLPVGTRIFSFCCHLPITCPSSFEGQYGHVRYKVQVILIRPWNFDQTFTRGFTVLKLVDLNHSPMLRGPTRTEISKTFGFGLFKTEPLVMAVDLPQSGYVPGQFIPVSVLITNNGNKEVKGLKISLVMVITYYSQTPTRHVRSQSITVSKLKGESVMRQCTKFAVYELPVPPAPPTDSQLSSLVLIAYQVEVEALMPLMQPNQVICVPVSIGNVPLPLPYATTSANGAAAVENRPIGWVDDSTAAGQATPANAKEAGAAVGAEAVNLPPTTPPWETGASNIPPPTYEEALHMPHANINEDEAHDYAESDFAPRYPVFNIPSPPTPLKEKPS